MGASSEGSESEPTASEGEPPARVVRSPIRPLARIAIIVAIASTSLIDPRPATADALEHVRTSGHLSFGADEEGGAPYFFKDEAGRRVGFEAELMEKVGRILGAEPEFHQGQWEYLLPGLKRGEVDAVINGYELTAARSRDFLPTRPYYVYQLQLMARRDGPVRSWADFDQPRPGGGPWKVVVMGLSSSHAYAEQFQGKNLRIYLSDGATNAMRAVRNGPI